MNRARNWWQPAVCGVAMLLYAAALPAADVYSMSDSQGSKVRLFDEPCPVATGWLKLKKAEFTWKGKIYEACWAIVGVTVLILDSEGDVSGVPISSFSKERAI